MSKAISYRIFKSAALVGALLASFSASADIVISGTRVIYNEKDKDEMVRLENKGGKPLLVQTWIDKGKENVDPAKLFVPFTLTPPVFRIEPKRGQTLRIMYTQGAALPADRESVFWLNVLEIPPKLPEDKSNVQNLLQLAFKTRIKLFYRPANLAGNAIDAIKELKWSIVNDDNHVYLKAKNNSPYYVSFSDASFTSAGKKYSVAIKMLPPMSEETFTVSGLKSGSTGKVDYVAINDFGGSVTRSVTL
ncbi:fimbrial chaperone [Citrobacter sp. Marseille-Q6884]|uniref:fimbrial chaperone n=1 Tax=Citrobacter sp. Marseille-Q6884 TaxID=2956786 RepID=UPI0021B189CD|nr:fimbrial chaperone [Citrobacter sp. Marseille-Q6884]